MKRARYTLSVLRGVIAEINDSFEEHGFAVRYREAGRNGYQAVDEYYVYPDGTPMAAGAVRNICCGTSRECGDAAWQAYYGRWNKADKAGLLG